MSGRQSGFRLSVLVLFACALVQTCGDSPAGPDSAESINELERGLAASGHLECRELVLDLWSRLGTLSREERLVEVIAVANECVRGMRSGMLTVMASTIGAGTDANGYEVTLGSTTLRVPANGTVSFSDLRPGRREVRIGDVASNCTVLGNRRRSDVVTPHRPGQVAFQVECSGGDGGPSPPEDPGFETVICPDVALDETAAIPFEPIGVGSLPDGFGAPLAARVVDPARRVATFTFIESDDDGTAAMIAPLHPSAPIEGGAVSLTITDGTLACAPMDFVILPLPPAPGTFATVVGHLAEIARVQAEIAGYAPEALVTVNVTDLPPHVWPTAVTWSIAGDPGNPNSLASLSAGGLGSAETDLLDRVLARTDIVEELEDEVVELRLFSASASASSARGPLALSAIEFDCIGIRTAEELDFCMSLANTSEFKQTGATGEALSGIGRVFGLVGLINTPVTKSVSTVAGIVTWLRQVSLDAMANILPSRFVPPMTVEYKSEFMEDEPGPGAWGLALARATSMGWTMDKAVLEAVFQYVGVKGGGFGDFLKRADFAEAAFDTAVANHVLTEVVNALIGFTQGAGFIQVESKVHGPVDISAAAWSDRDLTGESVVMRDHDEYDPVKAGTSLLVIRSKDGKFGFQQIRSAQLPIDVKQIQVHISPDQQFVEESELLIDHFTVTVTNSEFPEMVEIDPSVPLAGSASIRYAGEGTHHVSYTAPSVLDPLPDLLTVRHTASTGARNPALSPPERLDTAVIQPMDIEIMPSSVCLEPDSTQQFQVEGLPVEKAAWTTVGGESITSTGFYRAPGAPAEVLVIVTSTDNPTVADTADVRVGDCSCNWSVTVDSRSVSSTPGDGAVFGFVPFLEGDPIVTILLQDTDLSSCESCGSAPNVLISQGDTDLNIVGPGTYTENRASGGLTQVGQNPPFAFFDSASLEEGVVVFVSERTETSLIGTATGMVRLDGEGLAPEERPVVPFSASFAISAPPDVQPGPFTDSISCSVE